MGRLGWVVVFLAIWVPTTCVHGAEERWTGRTPLSEKRVALVIGNSAYQHTARLANPKPDAEAMGTKLRQLGFEVEVLLDLTKDRTDAALRKFGNQTDGADAALFYYAGHGMQLGGVNYLMPVDAKLAQERDVKFETIGIPLVLEMMENARNVKLVFLDACRDNPLANGLSQRGGGRSALGRGFARVEGTSGTLISFATKDGATAEDGSGSHSPYTQALLKHLETPELDVQLMLRKVREEVMRVTGNKQQPWEYGSLMGDFYFVPADDGKVKAPATPAVSGMDREALSWQSAQKLDSVKGYEKFLTLYPHGEFADYAKERLEQLKAKPVMAGGDPPVVEVERRMLEEKRRREEGEQMARQEAERRKLVERQRQSEVVNMPTAGSGRKVNNQLLDQNFPPPMRPNSELDRLPSAGTGRRVNNQLLD